MKPQLILSLPSRPVPYAVLGSPIHHSLSPVMQQAAFDACGLDARYYRIEVDEASLPRAVTHLREITSGGWNCTVPNKVKMMELCDRLTKSAQDLRAVNTVVNENRELVGHNTDGVGWSCALQEAFGQGPEGRRILLLGAGGASRAIATQAVLEKCSQLVIVNRKRPRAEELLSHLRKEAGKMSPATEIRVIDWSEQELEKALEQTEIVVNATSAGLDEKAPPVLPARMIPARLCVFDTLYGTGSLKLQREVELAGARWSDGLGMLLHQGAAAFQLWTGRDAPVEIMRRALQAAFSASRG